MFWLERLPAYRSFSDLPTTFKNKYRTGIARVVQDAEKRRYRHLNLVDVLSKYLTSIRNEARWEFVGEALTAHERNLRRSEFEQLFHAVGLVGVWSTIERNEAVTNLTVEGDANTTLEQMILDLVTYRNDASHGTPDEILGIDTLRDWVAFVESFCNALAAFITHRTVKEVASSKPETIIGSVTESISTRDNIVIATCHRGILSVGDQIFFLRETDCTPARINSLQIDGVSRTSIEIDHEGIEVGMQTSSRVRRGARLVRVDDDPPVA